MGSFGGVADIRWIPASTAAKMLKVTRQRVYTLVRLGQVSAVKLDGHTMVSMRSVEDRIERMRRDEGARNGSR
jgi:hypothetical protein